MYCSGTAEIAVLITGCSTGIGFDTALRLAKMGFMTFATVRKAEDGERLRKAANNSSMLQIVLCDVTKEEDRLKALETVKAKLAPEGRKLLALINNAGYSEGVPIELASPDSIKKQFDTNVYSVIYMSQLFLPLLREAATDGHWARVVNVSSVGGRLSAAGSGLYLASKHALEAISDSMRMELHRWKIHVVIIEPGAIKTSFYSTLSTGGSASIQSAKELLGKGKLPAGQSVLDDYSKSVAKQQATMSKIPMEPPAVVTDGIEAALLDSKPLSRYMCGWSVLPCHILFHLPTEIFDPLIAREWR